MKKILKYWQISLLAVFVLAFYMLIYWQKLNDFAEFLGFTISPNEEKCVRYYGIKTVAFESDVGWNAILNACRVVYGNTKNEEDYWRESYAECILKEFGKSDTDDIPGSFSNLAIHKCRYEISKEKKEASNFQKFLRR